MSDLYFINSNLSNAFKLFAKTATTDGNGLIPTNVKVANYFMFSADCINKSAHPFRSSDGNWYIQVFNVDGTIANRVSVSVNALFTINDNITSIA